MYRLHARFLLLVRVVGQVNGFDVYSDALVIRCCQFITEIKTDPTQFLVVPTSPHVFAFSASSQVVGGEFYIQARQQICMKCIYLLFRNHKYGGGTKLRNCSF